MTGTIPNAETATNHSLSIPFSFPMTLVTESASKMPKTMTVAFQRIFVEIFAAMIQSSPSQLGWYLFEPALQLDWLVV